MDMITHATVFVKSVSGTGWNKSVTHSEWVNCQLIHGLYFYLKWKEALDNQISGREALAINCQEEGKVYE